MGLADVARLTVYSTDVDEAVAQFGLFAARLGPGGLHARGCWASPGSRSPS